MLITADLNLIVLGIRTRKIPAMLRSFKTGPNALYTSDIAQHSWG
jgi:hypothetical protein